MIRLSLRVAFLVPFLAACHFDEWTVDGVKLHAHHEEVLTLDAWPTEGLAVTSHLGDVRAEGHDGPITLTVEVREREPGEAHALVENGRLVVKAANGAACAIGRVVLLTKGPVHGLSLESGMGDIEVSGLAVEGRLALTSGMGDVLVKNAGKPETIELSSGNGSVAIEHTNCGRLAAHSGMGSVRVEDLQADEAEVASGMGSVEIAHAKIVRVKADTGMGNIEIVESTFETKDVHTGMGSVHWR